MPRKIHDVGNLKVRAGVAPVPADPVLLERSEDILVELLVRHWFRQHGGRREPERAPGSDACDPGDVSPGGGSDRRAAS